jgi:hypothetical protein
LLNARGWKKWVVIAPELFFPEERHPIFHNFDGLISYGEKVRDESLIEFCPHLSRILANTFLDQVNMLREVKKLSFTRRAFPAILLSLRDRHAMQALNKPLLDRAIGVIYRPETERPSHYFPSRMPGQFDAVIQIDRTIALIPFERSGVWEKGELPETYPFAV